MAASAPSRPSPASHWAPMAEPNDLAVSIRNFVRRAGLSIVWASTPSCTRRVNQGPLGLKFGPFCRGASPAPANLHERR
jgi:hypothetical protein